MKNVKNVVSVAVLIIAVAAVMAAKRGQRDKAESSAQNTDNRTVAQVAAAETALPRLVDLGAKKCIPCKMMAPILQDLATSLVSRLEVEFMDVWEKPEAAEPYGINLIPTQIFFGPDGKELFRHEGFLSKEDILSKWKELGFDLSEIPAT
jgi:thioredoxin 1